MPNEERDTAESEKVKRKSKLVPVIIILIVILILAAGGFAAYKIFLAPMLSGNASQTANQESGDTEDPLGVAPKKNTEAGITYDIPTFVVNLADPAGTKYLRIGLSMEVPASNKKIMPEIEQRLPKIKDTIITVLSAKTLEEISTPQGKISLKQELLRRINGVLTSGKVQDIYLTDFVIQA